MKSPIERFEAKYTIAASGCWLWHAAKDQHGYGMFYLDGKIRKANRVSWMLYCNEDPKELLVCHKCDTPSCVNPAHLFLGTYTTNNIDCVNKARNTPCAGEANGRSKLTHEDVTTIRELAKIHSKQAIADMYPVSRQQISDIVNYKKWL